MAGAEEDFKVLCEAWAGLSEVGVVGALHLTSEDIEVVPFGARMQGQVYRGHDGLLDWWQNEILPNWRSYEVVAEDFQEVGDQLLVVGRFRASARTSGVNLDMPATWIVEVHDGKLTHWETFTDRQEALRKVGLAE
jgi:ketosteroid isomerase-like protein